MVQIRYCICSVMFTGHAVVWLVLAPTNALIVYLCRLMQLMACHQHWCPGESRVPWQHLPRTWIPVKVSGRLSYLIGHVTRAAIACTQASHVVLISWKSLCFWLWVIHLSASSTLDVATSSLVIKVGQGGPMSHTSHTKDTRRGQLYCS